VEKQMIITTCVVDKIATVGIIEIMKWYERAKGLMTDKQLTQEDLIPVLKVTRGGVGHYLSGRREPDIGQLIALARFLGCSLDYLLTGEMCDQPIQTKTEIVNGLSPVQKEIVAKMDGLTPRQQKKHLESIENDVKENIESLKELEQIKSKLS
jgi:transcriptional regulator with XRE-family HTH domain